MTIAALWRNPALADFPAPSLANLLAAALAEPSSAALDTSNMVIATPNQNGGAFHPGAFSSS